MVFLKEDICQLICHRSTERTATKNCRRDTETRWGETYIGVLCVDPSNEIGETIFFVVLVGNEKGVSFDVAILDLEASLVCNAIAISESGSAGVRIARHVMASRQATEGK